MNRSFYSFAVFFAALALLISAVHSFFYLNVGRPVYTMESFGSWFLLSALVTLIIAVMTLVYYHHKQYKFAFFVAIFALISTLSFSLLVYGIMMGAQLVNYYIPVYVCSLAISIIYGISLIPSPAGARPWLRAVGIALFVLQTFLLVVVVGFTSQKLTYVEVESIHQWTGLAALLIPVLFLINFWSELNTVGNDAKMSSPLKGTLTAIAILASLSFLIIGAKFSFQSMGAMVWQSQAPERTMRLAQPFEARRFAGRAGDTLLYRFMKPLDYDSTQRYPLVVCLHHGGTHGNDNIKQVDGSPVAQLLSAHEYREKYPAFLFVPQCPEGIGWGGIETLPKIDALVFEALEAFEAEFLIDEKRRYVAGNSGGGYGSWHFICTRPEMFAASIPICGGADPRLAAKIVDVPVWVFHGEDDTSVPVRFSREMVSAIRDAGGDPKYTEFEGAGHNIWEQVKATPGLVDWMFAQRRE